MRLNGQHAVVTGGGTGIGAAIAAALAAEGTRITLVGRRLEKLEEVAARLGAAAACAAADVTDRGQVDAAFATARAAHGPVSILINNAGASKGVPFARVSEQLWRDMLAVNLDAVFHCCQAALPDLLAAPAGRIVTIASIAGLRGFAYAAPYIVAKHGAVGLTRALAADFAGTNLTANAVCPGFVETEMTVQSVENIVAKTGRSDAEARAELARLNPSDRLIQPGEVADDRSRAHPVEPQRRGRGDRMTEALAIREKHDGTLGGGSSVRLWLRLLSCTMAIEKDVQRRFSARDTTLARFDLLAALDRHPEGMTMGALSRALLVSNGNVTQLVQKLSKDGLVRIATSPDDRRASIVRQTAKGRADFAGLAAAHHDWIDGLLVDMDAKTRETLYRALGALKRSIAKGQQLGS